MFCRNKDFETLKHMAKYQALHCETVYCNECRKQQKCLNDGRIAFFEGIGYAQTHTLWLNNSCSLTKEGHPDYKTWLKEN
ncbi:MAG: hypothetical protein KHZ90_08355 [Veillonella parvula]|uniref:Uncharacterized protein n=1 Tax=Veillonella parvula TaxID=29466 RepID=A0A943A442_VEIPA|nr:hypothetical protein [Veillonella parvula]MBS4893772.1 hypothetical protein [Veillonella parvula]